MLCRWLLAVIAIKTNLTPDAPGFAGRPGLRCSRRLGPDLFLASYASTPSVGTRSFSLLLEMALTPDRLPSIYPSLI